MALRAQAADLIQARLAKSEGDVDDEADAIQALHNEPDSRALRWRLGVDGQLADERMRRREIINFIRHAPQLRSDG